MIAGISDQMILYIGLIITGFSVLLFIVAFFTSKLKREKLNHQLDFEYGENPRRTRKRKAVK